MKPEITVTESARINRTQPQRIRQLIAQGRCPGRKIHPRLWLVPADWRYLRGKRGRPRRTQD